MNFNKIYHFKGDTDDYYYVIEPYRYRWIYASDGRDYEGDDFVDLASLEQWMNGDVETEWTKDEIPEFLLYVRL